MTSLPTIIKDRRAVIAIALVCCFLWGSAVPAVKYSYALFSIAPGDTPTLMVFAGVRFLLAGMILLALSAAQRQPLLQPPRRMAQLAGLGLISTAAQYLFYYIGLAHSTGTKVSIVTSTSTFFSVLLAHWLFANDRLSLRRAAGCLIGFAGVVVVNIAWSPVDASVSLFGEGFILVAAMLFSVGTIFGRGISQHMDTGLMTGWQLGIGGATLLVIGLLLGGGFQVTDMQGVLLLAYLAVISAAAFSLWGLLLKHNPVGVVAIFNCVIPIFGISLSGLVLGETILTWNNLAALALVTLGIWMVTVEPKSATR